MNKRKLGRTNLHVSELCLNTTKFGWSIDEASSFDLLDAYYTCGGSFLQSIGFCPSSAAAQSVNCDSEDIVGRWRDSRGINRDSLVLATRMSLFRPAYGGSTAFANLIREACEHSLRRLRTTHIDLLVCDWDEHLLPIDDVLESIDILIRAGLVRHAVAGGFPPWRVIDSLHRSNMGDHSRFEALQGEYSLMTRSRFESEALALCREHRLGFLARSPLAGGFLAQRSNSTHEAINLEPSWQSERVGSNVGDAVLTALVSIANKRLASPAQIALAWVLRNPHVTSALITASSPRELRELVRAASIRLSDDEIGALANVTTMQDYRMELRHV
jgi:aryl-alcohol dehydrogenase-like predicted oxidoreductase